MKILADYHTHTIFSCGNNEKRRHAKGTIEENVLAAIDKGLEVIGISEHGFNHNFYGLSRKNAKKEREEIDRLNKKYPQILRPVIFRNKSVGISIPYKIHLNQVESDEDFLDSVK